LNFPLDRRTAGVLLGAILAEEEAPQALEQLEGAAKERCQRELEAWVGLDRAARLTRTRELAGQLLLPGPERIGLIHPSWLEQALEGVHPVVAALVVDALPPALARQLGVVAGPCALPVAARLQLAQDILSVFERLDGPALSDAHLEDWLLVEAPSFVVPLERLSTDISAPAAALRHDLAGLESKLWPWAMGGVMAHSVLSPLGAQCRLLWRLPQKVGVWIAEVADALDPDKRWPLALTKALEERF